MNYDENFFKNIKLFYSLSMDNFNLINKQQLKFVEIFIQKQPEVYRENLLKVYKEWIKNSEMALSDYKNMVLKGLEYIDSVYQKSVSLDDKTTNKK